MPKQGRHEALRIALYYAAFGVIWVLGTDLLAERIATGEAELRRLSTAKGWLFVFVSTGIVYVLSFRYARSRERSIKVARDAEHRFRGLMEHSPDMAFWVGEPNFGKVHYVSSTLERLWGCPPERVYEDPAVLLEFVHPDDRERFLDTVGVAEDGASFDMEYRIVRPDGEVRWMRDQGYPVHDEAARIDVVAGVVQDITVRKAAFDQLRRSEELHRRAQRLGHIGHWELDPAERELTWSDEVYRIFGADPATFTPTPAAFGDRVHPEDRAARAVAVEAVLAGMGSLDVELRILRPDGEVRHVHTRATLVDGEAGSQKLVGTIQDITDRRRLQMEVEASHDLLRRYAATKIGDRERERTVLAREIHDQIGQLLTALKLRLGRELRHAEPDLRGRLVETMAVADSAIEEMRSISNRLRPPALDQLGLVEALSAYVTEFEEEFGLPTSFFSDLERAAFDPEVSGHMFRITQEALTNVVRHAGADRARVELRSESDAVVLRVLDDGVGLDGGPASDSFGIVGMRERAVLLGGSLELVDRDPRGLEVRVRIPTSET